MELNQESNELLQPPGKIKISPTKLYAKKVDQIEEETSSGAVNLNSLSDAELEVMYMEKFNKLEERMEQMSKMRLMVKE